ncbi:hypothetical protein, partial [Pantoea dispersa]
MALKDAVSKEIQRMMDQGIIQQSTSPYNNPMVMVKKRNGNVRIVLDARKLNTYIVPERDKADN